MKVYIWALDSASLACLSICQWVGVQSCLTLCHTVDCRPPGSSVRGIFQARILEEAAISFSRGSSRPRDQTRTSRISCIAGGYFMAELPRKPFMSVPYCFYYSNFVITLLIRDCGVSSFIVLYQLCLGSLGMDPMNFRVFCEKWHGVHFHSAPCFSFLVKKNGIIPYGVWQKSKKASRLFIFVIIFGSFYWCWKPITSLTG